MSFTENLWRFSIDMTLAIFGYSKEADESHNQGPLSIDILIGEDVVESEIECSICLYTFKLEESCDLLICGHYYHKGCYQEWKNTCIEHDKIVSCPLCRG